MYFIPIIVTLCGVFQGWWWWWWWINELLLFYILLCHLDAKWSQCLRKWITAAESLEGSTTNIWASLYRDWLNMWLISPQGRGPPSPIPAPPAPTSCEKDDRKINPSAAPLARQLRTHAVDTDEPRSLISGGKWEKLGWISFNFSDGNSRPLSRHSIATPPHHPPSRRRPGSVWLFRRFASLLLLGACPVTPEGKVLFRAGKPHPSCMCCCQAARCQRLGSAPWRPCCPPRFLFFFFIIIRVCMSNRFHLVGPAGHLTAEISNVTGSSGTLITAKESTGN